MTLRSIKLALATLFLCSQAYATTYYVATTGSDSNTGLSLPQAFLTLQKGADMATSPGDVVLVDDGTYTAALTLSTNSGSAESPKSISAITKANPCVVTSAGHGYSNGDIVEILGVTNYKTTGMQHLFNKFFKVANKTDDTFELTGPVDGVAVDSTNYDAYVGSGTVTRISPIIIRAINRDAAVIDTSSTVTGWTGSGTYTSSVTTIASGSSTPVLWRTDRNTAYTYKSSCGSVASEGDYCFSSNQFTLKTSVNPNSYTYKGFRRGNGTNIVMNGVSYILLDGFKTQYASDGVYVGSSVAATSHIVMDYIHTYKTVYHGGVFIFGNDAFQTHNIVLDHSSIEYQWDDGVGIDSNGHGIKIGGQSNTSNEQYITVSNSTIHDVNQHGIQFSNGVTSGYFYGNNIYNFSLKGSGSSAAIRTGLGESNHLSDKDTQIFDNDLGSGSGDTGYSIGCGIFIQDDNRGTTVFRNRIHHNTWHGIYYFYSTGARAPSNTLAFDNLIYANKTAGIRADNSYGGVNGNNRVYGNTFYDNGEASIAGVGAHISLPNTVSSAAKGFGLYNNIISSDSAYLIYTSSSLHLYPCDNNVYHASGTFRFFYNGATYTSLAAWTEATILTAPPTGLDASSVTGDPLFASPSSYDFRIPSPNTPADAIGADLSAYFTTDYTGEARQSPWDIGAYNTQGNLIVGASVTPSDLFPSRVTSPVVRFQLTEVSIANTDYIEVVFPDDFDLNSGGSTAISSVSGMDGTFTVSVASQTVRITRNGDGTTSAPGIKQFTLSHIKNPDTSGMTDVFKIYIKDSLDVETAKTENVAGVTISDVAPKTMYGGIMEGALFN